MEINHQDLNHPFGGRETTTLEFKEAARDLPKNLFESVCAFLNMDGGLIVLGAADDGIITGIDPDSIERIKTDIANLSNNPQKLDPPYMVFPRDEMVGDKYVIKIQVPSSSQVHRTAGTVFLRNEGGDYRISDLNRISGLVNRKISFFTEQRVLPHLGMDDLRQDLFDRAFQLMRMRNPQHPWAGATPEDLLKIAGFIRKDVFDGRSGYTLAAAMMFGTDEIIQSVAPGYKFDALLRRRDTERYDDRLTVRTNLIDAYDLLMGFIEKHLDDPFYLEGSASVSLRTRIFRELVANIITHREYTSAAPATIVIYKDRVEFKNPNVPHGCGPIDPSHFTPYPKNPTICKFMIQLGRYEELGSGVNNVTRFLPFYAPGSEAPTFIENDMFTTIVPLVSLKEVQTGVKPTVSYELEGDLDLQQELQPEQQELQPESLERRIMSLIKNQTLGKSQISTLLGQKKISGQLNKVIRSLMSRNLIEYTIPENPRSPLQKYRLTPQGIEALKNQR